MDGDDVRLELEGGWIQYSDFLYREVAGRVLEFRPAAGTQIVRLTSENARALEHLTGIINDLQATVRYCIVYESSFESALDPAVQDALWKAALVTYARCFEAGVRKSERPDLSVLDDLGDARKAHEYFMTLRSKYVAHSVNALEMNMTYALLTNDRGETVVARGPGTFQISSNPLNEQGSNTLKRLAETLLHQAQERHGSLSEAVMDELHDMSQEELLALPVITSHVAPDVASMRQTRR
ncbi:hypothetical protein [Antiquaquibacter soli]|uniref:Uncharacterized protein n=1 Tax=Antiquaquibacter soli TaxID=3064523 RepID=A0ABT9BMS4_9MICO|nr:hypothetical protein [Protaetiibacter sp. WY-16]MDO7882328.1 hypothetical protein [Protaetiibacter sp. WY-16]